MLVGARLFRLLEGGDGNLLLAVVFIPAIAIAGGWLAEKSREQVRRLGHLDRRCGAGARPGSACWSAGWRGCATPSETWQAVVGVAAWVALSVVFRFTQKAVGQQRLGRAHPAPGRPGGGHVD